MPALVSLSLFMGLQARTEIARADTEQAARLPRFFAS
jgi:hypothetical protein